VATSIGAKIIEKHFILDKSIGGPDASFSLDESEFTEMVQQVRIVEKVRGEVNYELTEKQIKGRDFSRSLYVVEDIKKGELFTSKNVRSIRPGFGLHPKFYDDVVGSMSKADINRGTPIELKYFK
jgi:pseudaminic acid synthase